MTSPLNWPRKPPVDAQVIDCLLGDGFAVPVRERVTLWDRAAELGEEILARIMGRFGLHRIRKFEYSDRAQGLKISISSSSHYTTLKVGPRTLHFNRVSGRYIGCDIER